MAVDHVVRVCLRVHVEHFFREAELAIPASSSIADVAEEVAWLVGAPPATRPWQAVTAAGVPIDPHEPLGSAGIYDGAVVVLEPHRARSTPVPRDAAEALVVTARATSTAVAAAVMQAIVVTGVAGIGVALAHVVSWWIAAAAAALVGLTVLAWRRDLSALADVIPLLGAASAGDWVTDPAALPVAPAGVTDSPPAVALACFSSAILGTLFVALVRPACLNRPVFAAVAILTVAAGLAALTLWAAGPLPALTCALGIGVASCWAAPTIASKIADLRAPRLPAAGESVFCEEPAQNHSDERARVGRDVYAAIVVAAAAVTVVELLAGAAAARAASRPEIWLGLSLCLAASFAMHAARHVDARALLAQVSICLAASLSVALTATHWWAMGVSIALACILATFGLWGPRLQEPEPTTLAWLERAETLALATAIPLAAHAAGVFTAIRGLG